MDKIKIVLINPDYMLYADPPLGLAYLASYVKKYGKGIEIIILDQLSQKQIIKRIKKIKPDVIGLAAVSLNFYDVKTYAEKVKQAYNDAIFVLGGVHVTTSPESFEKTIFDIAILGEAEKTLLTLLQSLQKNNNELNVKELKKIKGFVLRDGKKIVNTGLPELIQDLDEIPIPARGMLNMKYYKIPSFTSEETNAEPVASILTSRGCPYRCVFCSTAKFWTNRIRFFSAQRVVDEIEILYKKYGFKKIDVYDDLFAINKQRLRDIISLMRERKLLGKIDFIIMGRTDIFDEELAKLLKELGTTHITFGFETGSQKTLDYLKCGRIKIQDNIRSVELCKKYKIKVIGFFMAGNPYETEEDLKQTYEFIRDYCRDGNVFQTIAYPGTEVWQYAVKEKIIDSDHYDKKQKTFAGFDTRYLLSKDISPEKFMEWVRKMEGIYLEHRGSRFLTNIRPKHVKFLFSLIFLRKAWNLRKTFVERLKG